MVIWTTGLSGAGKTTLCAAIYARLKALRSELVLLDGDILREVFGADLGYAECDRVQQIRRIQALAKFLEHQGMIVLVAALYSRWDLFKWNRENFKAYFEIYLKAPLELLEAQDSKGIYSMAADCRPPNIVGVDIPWNEPQSPDLVIDMITREPTNILAERVIRAVPGLVPSLAQ